MDIKPFLTAFFTVLIAELGDKTQLATLSLASSSNSKWQVLLGAALALIVTSVLAVLLAEGLSKFVSPQLLKRLAGIVFLVLGILYLKNSF